MIDEDANGTRHQCGYEGGDDANIWHSVFQTSEALAEDIQQQRHETQGCDAGASCHDDAGRMSIYRNKH